MAEQLLLGLATALLASLSTVCELTKKHRKNAVKPTQRPLRFLIDLDLCLAVVRADKYSIADHLKHVLMAALALGMFCF